MEEHEVKVTNEIREEKDVKKLWEYIKKLKGKEISRKEVRIYDGNGKELNTEETGELLVNYWTGIYIHEGHVR